MRLPHAVAVVVPLLLAIQRTIVELEGPRARNGTTDSVPVTRAALADEARSVTCGDLTLADDGVTSGP
jgi:hypothetical protein